MNNFAFLCLVVWFLILACIVLALLGHWIIGSYRAGKGIVDEYRKEPRTSDQKFMFSLFWFIIGILIISIFFVGR